MIYVSEKHSDALAKLGFTATASADNLQNCNIAIVVDADARERGEEIARSLDGVAASIRILDLGDVPTWIKSDPAGANLAKLTRAAPLWKPTASDGAGGVALGELRLAQGETADGAVGSDEDAKSDEQLIAELAALGPLQFAKRKKEAAAKIGIDLKDLEKAVAKERGEAKEREQPEPLYDDWNVEPWDLPVDGNVLVQNIINELRRYVVASDAELLVVALWIIFTWAHEDAAIHSPILLVTSPHHDSGKSTLLEIVGYLSRRSMINVLTTGPVLFRSIDRWLPTFIVDEADTAFDKNPDLKEVFNIGWSRGRSKVIRCDEKTYKPRPFSVFCPKAIGMIGRNLPRPTLSRCLIIAMTRKKPDQIVEDFDHCDNADFARLRSQIAWWTRDNVDVLAKATPASPPGFHNRLRQNWRLLLAIADLTDCGDTARKAALEIEQVSAASDPDNSIQLLSDMRDVFDRFGDVVWTETLIAELVKDTEGPWLRYGKGKEEITDRQLAGLLKDFNHGLGIRSKNVRIGAEVRKGYKLADFENDFAAYLPPKTPLLSATPLQPSDVKGLEENLSATSTADVADKNRPNTLENNTCSAVADEMAVTAERCAQCHGEVDGEERRRVINGKPVILHPQCERFFIADNPEDLDIPPFLRRPSDEQR